MCTVWYIPDNAIIVLRLVWNLTVVALSIIVGNPLLNILGGYFIYKYFIPEYFSANLAGNVRCLFLLFFTLGDVIIFYSIPDGLSYDRLAIFLENHCLHSIQSRMNNINVIPMNRIYFIYTWNKYLILVC